MGWLSEQLEHAKAEFDSWPQWMKDASKQHKNPMFSDLPKKAETK